MKLNAKQLRNVKEEDIVEKLKSIKRRPLYFILENIYDTYNVGGLFRLADALAIEKMYLVGDTETPPNSRIKKASIGTYKIVPWEYKKTAGEVIEELKNIDSLIHGYIVEDKKTMKQSNNETMKIIAVEQHTNSIPYQKADYSFPIALIFGNESYGITPETLKLCDRIVEIPMWGINKSLNVIVSAAIVSYYIINYQ
jgi:tRNA G18 (ribose-2'-O)-methylase SpoU